MTKEHILKTTNLAGALKLAASQARQGQTDAATVIYTDILQQFPKNITAIQGLKELQSAAVSSKPLGKDPPQDQLQHLIDLCSQGQLPDALKQANELIAKFPGSVVLHNICGTILTRLQQYDLAINSFQKALKIQPKYVDAYNNLGILFKDQRDLESATECYRNALEIKPDHAEAHYNLGAVSEIQNDLEGAIRSYQKALEIKPDLVYVYKHLGLVLQKVGKFKEAAQIYKRSIALNSGDFLAYNSLGVTENILGKLREAESSFRQAILINSDYAEARYNLALTLQNIGEYDEAEVVYKRVIASNPDHAEAHNNLGVVQEHTGKPEKSMASYKQAIALKPDYADAYNNLEVIRQERNEVENSEKAYNKAILLNNSFQSARINRGKLLFGQKYFEAALQDFDFCNTPESKGLALSSLYALGRKAAFYERIKSQSEIELTNLHIAAFSAFISDVYKETGSHDFCNDPLDFLNFSNISAHLNNEVFFINGLIKDLLNIKHTWEPIGQSTHKGFQSAANINLFTNPTKNIERLRSIINAELIAYYDKFRQKDCSYIKNWPRVNKLYGWFVVLKEQGYQNLHIHPGGWLSGVIYLKVVPALGKDEGAIEFNLNGEYFKDPFASKIIYQPELGDIVLFPSSLHHRTIPFTTDTDRIIISFDLFPESALH